VGVLVVHVNVAVVAVVVTAWFEYVASEALSTLNVTL
jgi:hypothetical protein